MIRKILSFGRKPRVSLDSESDYPVEGVYYAPIAGEEKTVFKAKKRDLTNPFLRHVANKYAILR